MGDSLLASVVNLEHEAETLVKTAEQEAEARVQLARDKAQQALKAAEERLRNERQERLSRLHQDQEAALVEATDVARQAAKERHLDAEDQGARLESAVAAITERILSSRGHR